MINEVGEIPAVVAVNHWFILREASTIALQRAVTDDLVIDRRAS